MKISCYISLFDDWELLEASLKSVESVADEIVVIDGAYKWMTPFFNGSNRDITRSVDAVYDVLAAFGTKVRVVTGTWDNEVHKRTVGFENCRYRYVLRHDADEVLYVDQLALERFFGSGLGVAEVEIPLYAAPGWVISDSHDAFQRVSSLFDKNLISAVQHLSHLWLVLLPGEANSLERRETEQVFNESVAFNAHLTSWRPPATAVSRARFYVLNYIRHVGKLPWYPSFTYSAEGGFSDFFSKIDPRTFTDILCGDPIVSAPPDPGNGVVRPSPLSFDQEQVLMPLWSNFGHEAASLNRTLAFRSRAMASGINYHVDASNNESIHALEQDGRIRFVFSDTLTACNVKSVSLHTVAPYFIRQDLDPTISGNEVSFVLPQLPSGPDRPLRRAIYIAAWSAERSPIIHFRLAP
jgi:hypothetical protein